MLSARRQPSERLAYGIQLLPRLTWRQKQVAYLHARGMKAGAIAFWLRVKEPTIRTHINDIHMALGVESAAQLCVLAYEALLDDLAARGTMPCLDDAFAALRHLVMPPDEAGDGHAQFSRP